MTEPTLTVKIDINSSHMESCTKVLSKLELVNTQNTSMPLIVIDGQDGKYQVPNVEKIFSLCESTDTVHPDWQFVYKTLERISPVHITMIPLLYASCTPTKDCISERHYQKMQQSIKEFTDYLDSNNTEPRCINVSLTNNQFEIFTLLVDVYCTDINLLKNAINKAVELDDARTLLENLPKTIDKSFDSLISNKDTRVYEHLWTNPLPREWINLAKEAKTLLEIKTDKSIPTVDSKKKPAKEDTWTWKDKIKESAKFIKDLAIYSATSCYNLYKMLANNNQKETELQKKLIIQNITNILKKHQRNILIRLIDITLQAEQDDIQNIKSCEDNSQKEKTEEVESTEEEVEVEKTDSDHNTKEVLTEHPIEEATEQSNKNDEKINKQNDSENSPKTTNIVGLLKNFTPKKILFGVTATFTGVIISIIICIPIGISIPLTAIITLLISITAFSITSYCTDNPSTEEKTNEDSIETKQEEKTQNKELPADQDNINKTTVNDTNTQSLHSINNTLIL